MKMIFLFLLLSSNTKKEFSISLGYGEFDYYYDYEWKRIKISPLHVFNLFFKVTNNLFVKKGINFKGILGLNFSRYSFRLPIGILNEITWSSGFSPQSINFSIIMEKNFFTSEIGYHYDVGPEGTIFLDGGVFLIKSRNSDRQDAVFFNLKIKSNENPLFKAEANFKYIFTFPVKYIWYEPFFPEEKIRIIYYDSGDHIIFNPKISYKIKNFDLGVNFIHRYRTRDKEWHKQVKSEGVEVHNLSFSPFLRLNLSSSPLILEINTYVWGEYFPYGITLIAKNDLSTNACVTMNLKYSFK